MNKIAVLVVIKKDGSTTLKAGEKGDIYTEARELIRSINDGPAHDVARVVALGEAGTLKSYKWKANTPAAHAAPVAPTTVEAEEEPEEGDDEATASTDAKALRAALKAKGVAVPPRISDEKLIALAIEHGVEG